MSAPDISRSALIALAANLRAMAAAAMDSAANHDIAGRIDDAEHWAGRADGLMDAHSMVMAMGVLAAGTERVDADEHSHPVPNPVVAVEGGAW